MSNDPETKDVKIGILGKGTVGSALIGLIEERAGVIAAQRQLPQARAEKNKKSPSFQTAQERRTRAGPLGPANLRARPPVCASSRR